MLVHVSIKDLDVIIKKFRDLNNFIMLGTVELFSLQLVDGEVFADLCDLVDLDVGTATYDEDVSLDKLN